MNSRFSLLLFPVFIVCTPASAEWIRVASTTNGSIWSMDASRIKTVGGKRQAWIQVDGSGDRTINWRKSMQLVSYDCEGAKYKLLAVVNYDSYGKVMQSMNFPDSTYGAGYDPIIPDSMAETASTVACFVPKSVDE